MRHIEELDEPVPENEADDGEDHEDDEAGGGEGDGDAEPGTDGKPPRSRTRRAIEWAVVIGGALVVALVVRTFLVQAFWIPSESMEPTLHKGDRVLVNKLSYQLHDIHRGDVIVFERPPGEPAGNENIKDLIKRVIGLPGDTIETIDGTVRVNGRQLREPYIAKGARSDRPVGITRMVVPKHHYFVMGDNREHSGDSRLFGPIDEGLVVGRAFVLIYPPSDIGGL
jgi:signal peptidase I